MATGVAAYPFLNELLDEVRIKCNNLTCNVVPIINHFFWRNYNSSRTYDRHRYFISAKRKTLGDELLLPEVILRHNTNILLDDITLDDISNQLQIPIKTVMNDGQHLLHAVLGSETMSKPIVAIVGRPNVGKSTLFNKLIGQRLSIVDDTPGVTRDRIYGECEWENRVISLVDTGGIEPMSQDVILSQMRTQAQIAIDGADVIIMVTDVRSGVVATDEEVAIMLKKAADLSYWL